jgi:hypothetical protein
VLILIRIFDRPLGQALLALVCAAILIVAGLAERRKRPPDDLPGPDPEAGQRDAESVATAERRGPRRRRARRPIEDQETAERRVPRAPDPERERLFDPESGAIDELRSVHDTPTEPLPPPEFRPPERKPPPPPPPPPPGPEQG